MKLRLKFLALSLAVLLAAGCASTLSMWHDKSYTPVLEQDHAEVQPYEGKLTLTEGDDLEEQAEWLYSQGYLLLGYSKFTHTVVPGFSNKYALMYGRLLGAERVMQDTPRKVGSNVYAYTVSFWARGRHFPFGAYYNDVPDDARIYFPDTLRNYLDGGRPVLVEEVVVDSPAAAAGLEAGELIVGLNGEPLVGAEDLDQRLRAQSSQIISVTLWGVKGLRSADIQLGEVSTLASDIPGGEALFYRNPWDLVDYKDFSYISAAFQDAVNSSVAAYQTQQEAQRQAAYDAWQNSRVNTTTTTTHYSEREARARGIAPTRMGVPMDMKSLVKSNPNWSSSGSGGLGSAYGDLSSSWYFTHKNMWVPTVMGSGAAY